MYKCYICSKSLSKYYYSCTPEIKLCIKGNCFAKYHWRIIADKILNNKYHEYAVINNKVYQIGSEDDEPRGFGGKYWAIQFNDGTYVETHSLWYKGELPDWLQDNFKDNAKFIAH